MGESGGSGGVAFTVFAGLNIVWTSFFIVGMSAASTDYNTLKAIPWYKTEDYGLGCDMYYGLLANVDECTRQVNKYESCKNEKDYVNGCKNCYKYGSVATTFIFLSWVICLVSVWSNYVRGKNDSKTAKTFTTFSTGLTLVCGTIAFSVFLMCANSVSGEQHIDLGLKLPLTAFCGVFLNLLYNLYAPVNESALSLGAV